MASVYDNQSRVLWQLRNQELAREQARANERIQALSNTLQAKYSPEAQEARIAIQNRNYQNAMNNLAMQNRSFAFLPTSIWDL